MGVFRWTATYSNPTRTLNAYLDVQDSQNIDANSTSITLPLPTVKAKWDWAPTSEETKTKDVKITGSASATRYQWWIGAWNDNTLVGYGRFHTGKAARNTYANATWDEFDGRTISTASLFNSKNKTSPSVSIKFKAYHSKYIDREEGGVIIREYFSTMLSVYGGSYDGGWYYILDPAISDGGEYVLSTCNITLKAPPTFTHSDLYSDTDEYGEYVANGTTLSVDVSNLEAKYGGDVISVEFIVGNQSVTRTTEGRLSIKLNSVGTYIPTLKVKDSRGQVTEKTFNSIDVKSLPSPTFDVTQVTFDTEEAYQNISTATVEISNVVVATGASVVASSLTIGSATVTGTGEGELSLVVTEGGRFTPIVTVTDSLGQVSLKHLSPVSVISYKGPGVNAYSERCLVNGVPDDEGTYAILEATFNWADVAINLIPPKVEVIDQYGVTTEKTATWYRRRNSRDEVFDPVDWTTLESPVTIYGIVPDFNSEYSYQIVLTPKDESFIGQSINITLGNAFYTIDFLAGGHGIAFGKPSKLKNTFECDLDAQFNRRVNLGIAPIGSIIQYAGIVEPDGWFVCNGRELNRETYADLFNAIGTTYGAGDGSTTFNIPDFRGRVAVGASETYLLGNADGEETHQLVMNEMPSHNHNSKTLTGNMRVLQWNGGSSSGIISQGTNNKDRTASSGSSFGSNNFTITATHTHDSQGGGQAHNNMQPYLVTNFIIKWKEVGTGGSGITVEEMADLIRPIGSVYETTDLDFDPNVSLGGTWTKTTVSDDEIVEQGTDGIWTYKKWASGLCKCWGRQIFTSTTATAWGSCYWLGPYMTLLFPTNMFIDNPSINLTRSRGIEGWVSYTTSDKNGISNLYLVRPTTGTGNYEVSCCAEGLWKTYEAPRAIYKWIRTA